MKQLVKRALVDVGLLLAVVAVGWLVWGAQLKWRQHDAMWAWVTAHARAEAEAAKKQ